LNTLKDVKETPAQERKARAAGASSWTAQWQKEYSCFSYTNTLSAEQSWELPACMKDIVPKPVLAVSSAAAAIIQQDLTNMAAMGMTSMPAMTSMAAKMAASTAAMTNSMGMRLTSGVSISAQSPVMARPAMVRPQAMAMAPRSTATMAMSRPTMMVRQPMVMSRPNMLVQRPMGMMQRPMGMIQRPMMVQRPMGMVPRPMSMIPQRNQWMGYSGAAYSAAPKTNQYLNFG